MRTILIALSGLILSAAVAAAPVLAFPDQPMNGGGSYVPATPGSTYSTPTYTPPAATYPTHPAPTASYGPSVVYPGSTYYSPSYAPSATYAPSSSYPYPTPAYADSTVPPPVYRTYHRRPFFRFNFSLFR